jgi:hypothetical protein
MPEFQIITADVSKNPYCSEKDYHEPEIKPFKVAVRGFLDSSKGCMGILKVYGSDDDILLPEFANKCGEIKQYENKLVEIYGSISKMGCDAGVQCRGDFEMNIIESIKILD